MDYGDLLLLHFPCRDWEGTLRAYAALEAARARGRARAIGVSNFNAKRGARDHASTCLARRASRQRSSPSTRVEAAPSPLDARRGSFVGTRRS